MHSACLQSGLGQWSRSVMFSEKELLQQFETWRHVGSQFGCQCYCSGYWLPRSLTAVQLQLVTARVSNGCSTGYEWCRSWAWGHCTLRQLHLLWDVHIGHCLVSAGLVSNFCCVLDWLLSTAAAVPLQCDAIFRLGGQHSLCATLSLSPGTALHHY